MFTQACHLRNFHVPRRQAPRAPYRLPWSGLIGVGPWCWSPVRPCLFRLEERPPPLQRCEFGFDLTANTGFHKLSSAGSGYSTTPFYNDHPSYFKNALLGRSLILNRHQSLAFVLDCYHDEHPHFSQRPPPVPTRDRGLDCTGEEDLHPGWPCDPSRCLAALPSGR